LFDGFFKKHRHSWSRSSQISTKNSTPPCGHGSQAGLISAKESLTAANAGGQRGWHGIDGLKRTIRITSTGVIVEIEGENPTAIAALHARFSKMKNVLKTVSAKPKR